MGKYHKYTDGQKESIFNMVGGEEKLDQVLARTHRIIVVPINVPVKLTVICCVFSGNRCSICGGQITEGDDVCAAGHIVGQLYDRELQRT
jgi:hypothetical protein